MIPSKEYLISVAHDYWRQDKDYQLRQEKSPEERRREARWNKELEKIDRWHALLRDLRQELPEFTIGDGTATPDACFRCVAYPAKGRPMPPHDWVIVGCISILAPIYIVYSVQYGRVGHKDRLNPRIGFEPFPLEMKLPADILSRKIEETFGVSKLPREIAETPVPLFVKWVEPPETTLFHALFTNEPDNVP
ncbi:hypothetical protein F0U60_00380 [Archangium minus]|uniref:Uncharacterized protein n=1 Tax=Archangium minus TaxID=83450 RepID=A0ABY9WJV8_9BACT|nr:hypothetical protein F0U60_00380 [Archangium minus]